MTVKVGGDRKGSFVRDERQIGMRFPHAVPAFVERRDAYRRVQRLQFHFDRFCYVDRPLPLIGTT